MNNEILSKLYLELSHVVPFDTKTFREIDLENKITSLENPSTREDITPEEFRIKLRDAMMTDDPLPMEAELWAAGADFETANFVARMLDRQGYGLVKRK